MVHVAWLFNTRNILEYKQWVCFVWEVWPTCTSSSYQDTRKAIVGPWASLRELHDNVAEEADIPQIVTGRSDIRDRSCMCSMCEALCRLPAQNQKSPTSSLAFLHMHTPGELGMSSANPSWTGRQAKVKRGVVEVCWRAVNRSKRYFRGKVSKIG